VRTHSLFILLSDSFHSISNISRITKCDSQQITRFFNAWDSAIVKDKLKTLSIASGFNCFFSSATLFPNALFNAFHSLTNDLYSPFAIVRVVVLDDLVNSNLQP